MATTSVKAVMAIVICPRYQSTAAVVAAQGFDEAVGSRLDVDEVAAQ